MPRSSDGIAAPGSHSEAWPITLPRRERLRVCVLVLVVRERDLVPGGGELPGPRTVVQLRIEIARRLERGGVHDREVSVVERMLGVLDFFLVAARGERGRSAEDDTVTARHGRSPSE